MSGANRGCHRQNLPQPLGETMTIEARKQFIDWQQKVTRALLKFSEDHNYPSLGLTEIREALRSLERSDINSAVEHYRRVPLGGRMGYFDDWLPPVVFSHETAEYVEIVFRALVNEWERVMKLSSTAP
jgi:hypothetical protein